MINPDINKLEKVNKRAGKTFYRVILIVFVSLFILFFSVVYFLELRKIILISLISAIEPVPLGIGLVERASADIVQNNRRALPFIFDLPSIIINNFKEKQIESPVAVISPEMSPGEEDIDEVQEEINEIAPAIKTGPYLYMNSFPFSFVSFDWTKSDLYFDNSATALYFPLDYQWTREQSAPSAAEQAYFQNIKFNEFNGPYNDERCLNNNCLTQTGLALYYNNAPLDLTGMLDLAAGDEVAAVSIASLSSRWLVGVTIKNSQQYRGQAFYFDGRKFTPLIFPSPITSNTFGLFGFGGTDDDFLAIFSALSGTAYRIRGDSYTNISKFFGFRVVNFGFKAEVIKVGSGNNTTWYVISSTFNRPHFIKLWQNGGAEIAGVAAFDNLFISSERSVYFKLISDSSTEKKFMARVVNYNGNENWFTFIDRGFDNQTAKSVISYPMPYDKDLPMRTVKSLARSYLDIDALSASAADFFFSSDGEDWQHLPQGEGIDYYARPAQQYFLKITYPAVGNKFHSPFIDYINFALYSSAE